MTVVYGVNSRESKPPSPTTVKLRTHECHLVPLPLFFKEARNFFPIGPLELIKLKRWLDREARTFDLIVIHGVLETVPLLFGLLMPQEARSKLVWTDHGFSTASHSRWLSLISRTVHYSMGRLLLSNAEKVVVFSNESRRELERLHPFNQTTMAIVQLPLGIDAVAFSDRVQLVKGNWDRFHRWIRYRVGQEDNIILALGTHTRTKGFATLLRAARTFLLSHPNALLVIAGDYTPYTVTLRQLASDLEIRRQVSFLGRVSEEQKVALMIAARVIAIPSIKEGYGLVAVEGRILGTPIIATLTGAHEEILNDSEVARLVPPGDVPSLALALNAVWEMHRGLASPAGSISPILERFDVANLSKEYINMAAKGPGLQDHIRLNDGSSA